MVCTPQQQALQGKGEREWGASEWNPALRPQGCRISLPGPEAAAFEEGEARERAGRAQPFREGSVLPSPRAPSPGRWRPSLGLPLALARVLSCRACLLWSGEKRGVTSEEGEDYLAFLEHFTFLPALADV